MNICFLKNEYMFFKMDNIIKESTNNFNLYLDNPLSLIQIFMLALFNIRI